MQRLFLTRYIASERTKLTLQRPMRRIEINESIKNTKERGRISPVIQYEIMNFNMCIDRNARIHP